MTTRRLHSRPEWASSSPARRCEISFRSIIRSDLCEDGCVTNLRMCALIVLSLAAAGCGQGTGQKSGRTAQRLQTTSQQVASYGVPRSELPPSCAHRGPRDIPPNTWAPTRSQLAPSGAIAIRLCRYGAVPDVVLQRSTLLTTPSLLKRLVAEFDRLPRPPLNVNCPEEVGSEVVAHLSYHDGRRVTIRVGLTGCVLVSNGHLLRSASGFATPNPSGPELLAELGRLVSGLTP